MKKGKDEEPSGRIPGDASPFDRFVEFARKVVAVPKAEIEERERIYREERRRKQKAKV